MIYREAKGDAAQFPSCQTSLKRKRRIFARASGLFGRFRGRPVSVGLLLAMLLSLMAGCGGPKDEPYHGTVSLKRFPQKKTTDTSRDTTK